MVKPHPTRSLCPIATPGSAGSPDPITFHPGPLRWTKYRNDGRITGRCGSLASSGAPVALSFELTTQLFDPSCP